MTREHKLALILGFSIVLVVGVLVSDHLSGASLATIQSMDEPLAEPNTTALLAPGQSLHDDGAEAPPAMAMQPDERESELLTDPQVDDSAISRSFAATGLDALIDAVRTQMGSPEGATPPVAGQLRTETPEETSPTDTSTKTLVMPPSAPYVIQESETLWAIAQEHYGDASVHQKIAVFNEARIGEPGSLRIGATIYLPEKSWLIANSTESIREAGARPFVPESAPRPAMKPNVDSERTYTVAKGDTLGEISMRLLGTSKRWREIVSMNSDRISNPDRVPAGVVLRIPGD